MQEPTALDRRSDAAGLVLRPALVALLVFTVLCGFVYPLVMDAIAAIAFPHQATGSLIRDRGGHVVGSELVGQPFDDPAYFWSRPTGDPSYNAMASAATNLAASGFVGRTGEIGPNPALVDAVRRRIAALRAADPGNPAPVPVDLVTSSGSGLDPDISPAAADFQIRRVARLRGQPEAAIRTLVDAYTEGRTLGLLGEPRVNVLLLNRALDAKLGAPQQKE